MKKILIGAALVGALLLLIGADSGRVVDKRAPGEPGEKVFQLHVDGAFSDRWVTVTEKQWDTCSMYAQYPQCVG